MFDERTVNAYRSVTAPSTLKEKVLARQESVKTVKYKKKTSHLVRQLSAAAACLVLIVGVWSVTREQGSLESGIHATVLVEDAQEMIRTADAVPVTVELKLDLTGEAELTCKAGELLVQGKDDISPVNRGSEWRTDGSAVVLWQVPALDTVQTYEMTVNGENETVSILLSYDAAENCWAVSFAG